MSEGKFRVLIGNQWRPVTCDGDVLDEYLEAEGIEQPDSDRFTLPMIVTSLTSVKDASLLQTVAAFPFPA